MRGRVPRLRASSFVPVVQEVSPEDAWGLPELGEAVLHWTGGEGEAGEWISETRREWGNCGFKLSRGEECLGFVLFGPPGRLPGSLDYPFEACSAACSAPDEGALLACLAGDGRTAKRLLVRMLRDLRGRGVRRVEAIASDGARRNHAATGTLLRAGWRPVDRALFCGRFYTLLELDLAGTVETGERARTFIGQVGQVRLPQLGRREAPGALAARTLDEVRLAFEESSPGERGC
ncbi:Hypothetical Protein RradSPS_0652 [Rubrobacter radiotolerans]|nr:Hypothetical Protein RradSPS_0652 [Rubrobacter radiotolerans]SMC03549.1 conserved hypothetical protein [Rubrobacter radiotolerans DSM 5868]